MINKKSINSVRQKLVLTLFVFILIALLSLCSFYRSKLTAEALVGDTIKDYPLSRSVITILAIEEKRQIVWDFKFSFPGSFDEEFYIYTTLWGKIVATNPRKLETMLRKLEIKQIPEG